MTFYAKDRKRKYRSALRQLVSSWPTPASNPLPLTHVTDCIHLPTILDEGQLTPRKCAVFGDLRLYAFYARPAYRGSKEGALHNLNSAPVCFIIDASATLKCQPVDIYPFDTGALKSGKLVGDIHEDLSPFDFALEPKVDSAQRLVSIFFGDERTYYSGDHRRPPPPGYSPTDAEMVAYDSLVRRGGNMERDERGTSIEFQFKDALPLAGKTLAIILPHEFLDVPHVKMSIDSKKITPLPYTFIPDHSVKEFVGVFYTLAEGFYIKNKKKHGWQW